MNWKWIDTYRVRAGLKWAWARFRHALAQDWLAELRLKAYDGEGKCYHE